MRLKFDKFKLNKDFRRLYGRGKSFVCPFFVTYVAKRRTDTVSLGITAGKKIGNAVCRNRAKRVIRAAFYQNLSNIKKGTDLVIVARTRILTVKSTTVCELMKSHLIAAGVWCENNEKTTDSTN